MAILFRYFHQLRNTILVYSETQTKKWKNNIYLILAGAFTLFIIADYSVMHLTTDLRQEAYDIMVRYRLNVPKPDNDIIIVDINEASLNAMSKEYGRWPWPRQVLGEFVEQIEKQHPAAVVFDILFSDADIYNEDSDNYFNAAISSTDNTFFPMLRLDSADDSLSQVRPDMIPGVSAITEGAQKDATVAIIIPFFLAIQQSGRMGLHNIYPDDDGIVRQYPVYLSDYGWKIPSLPLRIGQHLKFANPQAARVLLNWRGPPFTYQSVTFSDLFADMSSKNKKRSQVEFYNKIVIIGSTAPSLFDIKPTPLSQMHPGVEILATAIDNFKHGDFLRNPDMGYINLFLALCVIWATAWSFYFDAGRVKIDRLFGASQAILISVSYASINLTNTYINLTGPFTLGIAYYSIARLCALVADKTFDKSHVSESQLKSGGLVGVLMLIRIGSNTKRFSDHSRETIRLDIQRIGSRKKSVEILIGRQRGIWNLFENIIAVSWLCESNDEVDRISVNSDVDVVQQAVVPLLQKYCEVAEDEVTWFVNEMEFCGGQEARENWYKLFVETLAHCHTIKRVENEKRQTV